MNAELAGRYPAVNFAPEGVLAAALADLAKELELVGGNDFLVTLGYYIPTGGTLEQQAGTFMHEFGDTLGRRHGGGDSLVYKPNYFSVMNYTWQWPQWEEIHPNIPFYWRLDYSHYALPSLDEKARLDESVGLNPSPGEFVAAAIFPYNGPANAKRIGVFAPATEVDWDGSGDSSGSASQLLDVNWLDGPATPGEVLTGYADWPNLRYNILGSPVFSDPGAAPPGTIFPSQGPEVEELTKEMYDSLQALPRYGFIPGTRCPGWRS